MHSCVSPLFFIVVYITYVAALSTKLAGPYDIEFRRIEHCEDEGTKEFKYHTKLNKISKYDYAYNGDWTFCDTTNISIENTIVKKLQSGTWAKVWDYHVINACEDLKRHFPEIFTTFTKDYLKVPEECPIPGATYKAENWIMSVNHFPLKELEYGEYKAKSVMQRGEQRIGCIEIYVDVEEKADD